MTELLSQDQVFLRKLQEIIEGNISRGEFDVGQLAREAKMSRSAIHRRLRKLGRLNASHFIREIRLQKAREMLHNGFFTASEVAYRVGFGSPTYFSKCYHEYYGYPPGEERKRTDIVHPDEPEVKTGGNGSHNRGLVPGLRRKGKVITITALSLAFLSILLLTALNQFRYAKEMSIVVLPFRCLSGGIENQYLADGITEDILNSLCQVNKLRVVSRTTSVQYRNTNLTAGEIVRKLNVRNVLEGSVRSDGERVRITVQLIDGKKERIIWSETYDLTSDDMPYIQYEIARQVAAKLSAGINSDKELRASDNSPADPQVLN